MIEFLRLNVFHRGRRPPTLDRSGRGARRAIVHLYNSTSTLQRRVVFNLDRAGIVDIAVREGHAHWGVVALHAAEYAVLELVDPVGEVTRQTGDHVVADRRTSAVDAVPQRAELGIDRHPKSFERVADPVVEQGVEEATEGRGVLALRDVEIRTVVRTGDTPQRERAAMLRTPPLPNTMAKRCWPRADSIQRTSAAGAR